MFVFVLTIFLGIDTYGILKCVTHTLCIMCPLLCDFLPWPWSEGSAMTIRHPFSCCSCCCWGISSGDTRRKQTATWLLYLGPPQIFTDSEPTIKWLIGGLIRVAPDPPYPPPMGGGAKGFFWGVMTAGPFLVKYFLKALDLKYIFSYSWGVPRPPDHLPP